ncbi:MAG: hypothetical protein V1799_15005 [bacterium]
MQELHLSTSYHAVLLFLALGVAFGLSWFSYRFTIPPISRFSRAVLFTLRALALWFLFLLLGDPLLTLISRSDDPPEVLLLIDDSKSLAIKDKGGDRRLTLTAILKSNTFQQLSGIGKLRTMLFHEKSRIVEKFAPDSMTWSGDQTDLGGVLKAAGEAATKSNIRALLLLSDGVATVGTSPRSQAENLGLPIFTIGIGDSTEQRDISIQTISTNSITFVGNKVAVKATIKSSGFDGERVEVILRDAYKQLDRQTATLQSGVRNYAVTFSMTPEKEGLQKFSLEISKLQGEVSHQNNAQAFFVKVLKSKMSVTLIAGAPGADGAFIRRALAADKNIALSTFIERGNGQFYEGTFSAQSLKETECLILIGFPSAATPPAVVMNIAEAARTGTPLFWMPGRLIDVPKAKILEPALPVILPAALGSEGEVFFTIADNFKTSPVLKFSPAPEAWTKLPPMFRGEGMFKAKAESEVLGYSKIQSVVLKEPLFVSRNVNRTKSLALLGYGVWRWKSFADPASGFDGLFDQWFSNCVRWLTTREDDRKVRVQPAKEFFSTLEKIDFFAQVYDANYQPITDADVALEITKDNQLHRMTLTSLDGGRYEGSMESLSEGDYHFKATVMTGGQLLADEKGSFSVGGVNAEYLDIRMNKLLLQQLALQTGGTYYDAGDIQNLPKDISAVKEFKQRETIHTQEYELWNRSWMLGLMVLLFAGEWFLRKRIGML